MKGSTDRPRRALVCAPMPPEFDRESGSRRVHHLIEMLRADGWDVSFVCESAPTDSRHVRRMRQQGIPTYVGVDRSVEALVANGRFDLAVFAFWYMADRYADIVRRLSPDTRIVVDTVDLHWLRKARRVFGGHDGPRRFLDDDYGAELVGELNAYARADGVLTVSGKEADLLADILGGDRALPVPDHDDIAASPVPLEERRGILFIGNFRHPPNRDAVEFLCRDVLPLLPIELRRAHPTLIVGNAADERIRSLALASDHVDPIGWVPSVVPYLHSARISVVPLRYGAGTKRKLLQALMAETPTVTTPAGVEGIAIEPGRHVLVGSDAACLARHIETLLTNDEAWRTIARAGRARILELHGRDVATRRLRDALDTVLSRPRAHEPAEAGAMLDRRAAEVSAVHSALEKTVPERASVLIVSRGDPDLVRTPFHRARHFPQAEDGQWAGYHPRDSRAALRHLDEVRESSDYLVFPGSALWWLEYYGTFARHLDERFQRVWSDDQCVIYRLGEDEAASPDARRRRSVSSSKTARDRPSILSPGGP